MTATPDFGRVAASYDELRPADANWWELVEALVREGDLLARRVLEIGCGTGRLAAELARRGARVWAVDPSPEMLERARANAPAGAGFKLARAEELPFKDGWFDRAVLRLVVHLVDRPRALAELRRVLDRRDGRAAVATFDPVHFDAFWLNRLFPSLEAIDRARFPVPEELAGELEAAGFRSVRIVPLDQRGAVGREEALRRIRGRYISTLALIGEDEYRAGLARAEEELPDLIEYGLEWRIVTASSASPS